jgi:hypothetical protein
MTSSGRSSIRQLLISKQNRCIERAQLQSLPRAQSKDAEKKGTSEWTAPQYQKELYNLPMNSTEALALVSGHGF